LQAFLHPHRYLLLLTSRHTHLTAKIMLLRFRGPDGMVRIIVEHADTFARLGEKVSFP